MKPKYKLPFIKGGISGIVIIAAAITLVAELLLFNMSTFKMLGTSAVSIAENISIDGNGEYTVGLVDVNDYVRNIYIEDMHLVNAEYAEVYVTLTDEGDEYEYALPECRVVPGIKGSGYINIYPYGKVKNIQIHITLSEGAEGNIGRICLNAVKPFSVKPIRIIVTWLVLFVLIYTFKSGFNIMLKRKDRKQITGIALLLVLLVLLGRQMSVSNDLIVSCPWPHHKQYMQLAEALSNHTVILKDMEASEGLLAKENPYDTIALTVENIPYNMDYAYYKGNYYVYFGIVPELLLYYPFYILTGRHLSNYNADLILYMIFIAGVLLSIRELIFRFASSEDDPETSRIPYFIYMLMCISICLFSGAVYLISRPDIYNIPIMAATALTFAGIGLWSRTDYVKGIRRKLCMAAGSLCMAMVAGCRPQMLLYSLVAVFIFFIPNVKGRLSLKDRKIFTRETLSDTLAFILPYVIIAVLVCTYNYLRFDNILDFGATYSLTTNDMNHRGFNLDRLLRGIYCFLFQPPVFTTDFPYMQSAVIESSYMGKNLTEYTYGGVFATNLTLLVLFVPLIMKIKGLNKNAKAIVLTLVVSAVFIAGFDVNGAGILIRYTCDMMPGLIIAAIIVWIVLLGEDSVCNTAGRIYVVFVLMGLAYSFLVFIGTEGSVNLRDNSVVLYENIRQYFMW
ncbi:MAG: hypothetical protein K5868_07245 [Lachnospiraceae bacterium]|nr:hypothetical protein [Lachnospiraceae bacterium]